MTDSATPTILVLVLAYCPELAGMGEDNVSVPMMEKLRSRLEAKPWPRRQSLSALLIIDRHISGITTSMYETWERVRTGMSAHGMPGCTGREECTAESALSQKLNCGVKPTHWRAADSSSHLNHGANKEGEASEKYTSSSATRATGHAALATNSRVGRVRAALDDAMRVGQIETIMTPRPLHRSEAGGLAVCRCSIREVVTLIHLGTCQARATKGRPNGESSPVVHENRYGVLTLVLAQVVEKGLGAADAQMTTPGLGSESTNDCVEIKGLAPTAQQPKGSALCQCLVYEAMVRGSRPWRRLRVLDQNTCR
ncbi:hypothetical protein B0J13DRAFT_520883 [Dactylonectria estremocensis]|uniref:Uncharacterized protein n=1 Tax=Dactylonectria estremocensis TaxID=1079267 RepID=A0A9P9JHJ7_9HYPO|nr:hypothetical protein B0J13DRAFT_520883 [Dactylonectria estremocensis]